MIKKTELAIDFGSKYITIYKKNVGIVLHEPTICVVSTSNKGKVELVAAGSQALEMIGKTGDEQKIIYPISEGIIVHKKVAQLLISNFLDRIKTNSFFKQGTNVLACVSCGITNAEKKEYEDILLQSAINDVTFIESPICVAQLSNSQIIFSIDIGGAKSEIAIVNESGIVVGCSIDIAGDLFNQAIMEYVSSTHKIILQRHSTEKLKTAIASLYDNDASTAMVTGRSVLDNNPKTIKIGAIEIKKAILSAIEKLCDIIEKVSLMVPKNLAEPLYQSGIILSGGSANINGLSEYMERRLRLRVEIVDDPEKAVVSGAAKLLDDRVKLGKLLNLSNFK